MKIANLKIGARLIGSFVIVLAMLVGVSIVGLTRMASIQDSMVSKQKNLAAIL